jgi:hypothetical protein
VDFFFIEGAANVAVATDEAQMIVDALLPIVAAFGDAREAAGREQGRQDAAEETEAARRWLVEQGARPTMADVERLRGSGVAVQPTPEEQP